MAENEFPTAAHVVQLARQLKEDQLWVLYKMLQRVDREDLYFLEVEQVVKQSVRKYIPSRVEV